MGSGNYLVAVLAVVAKYGVVVSWTGRKKKRGGVVGALATRE